ncbi:MAG: T9SS type A sorting domain-containing protein [Bacteroidales bacterium]|nr:T9SS type A sorting domain-containing protein [Bacteroidales bacterium]
MKNLILCLIIILAIPLLSAEQGVSIYSATRESGIVYTPLGDSGSWATSWRAPDNPNNSRSYPIPLGFSFNYLGNTFTEVNVSTNGFMDFSTNTAAGDQDKPYGFDNTSFSLPAPNGTLMAIAPFYDDLMVTWGYTLSNSIKYLTSGSAGNRVFTVEWVHFSMDQSNSDHVNFQVKLYEATSKIEFIYGAMSAVYITPTYTCGINAAVMSNPPTAAQLLTQQVANSPVFGSTPKNNLSAVPEPYSKIVLTGCLLPGAAGTIDGPSHVCLPSTGLFFSIPPIPAATGYIWNLPAGFTIVSGNNSFFITVNASNNASPGNITVTGINACGSGVSSSKEITVSVRPTPIITGPDVVCSGLLEYVFSTQSAMSNYQWIVSPSGTITSGSGTDAITVVWQTSGTDTVSVNYNDVNGCPSRVAGAHVVTVNPMTNPVITGPSDVCINSQGNVYSTEAGMTDYLWMVSDGGIITSGGSPEDNTVTVTWNTTGSQMVSVTYMDINGCSPLTPTNFPVMVNSLPVPVITGPQASCIGSSGNVYATQQGMLNYSWQVSPGGTVTSGGTPSSSSVTVNWNSVGPNTVSVNYTTPSGCTAISPTIYNITVGERPTPTISGPATACPGSANNVYMTQSGMTNYAWVVSPGGIITAGGTSTSNIAVVTWNGPGAQTISVNYNNIQGCAALTATTYAVFVELLPVPALTGPDTVCQNTAENIYATETGMSNYIWTVSGGGVVTSGGTITSPTITVQWILPGTQSVQVNYTNFTGCQTVSPGTFSVTVNTLPIPSITGDDSVCSGTSGHFYMTETGMTNYEWSVSEGGEILSGAGTPVIEVRWNLPGTDSVNVNYTDTYGCPATIPSGLGILVLSRPAPVITGPDFACIGTPGYLYLTEPGMMDYVWDISPGGTITSGPGTSSVTVTWNETGDQSISVGYTSMEGCPSESPATKSVIVNDLPLPSITGNTGPCVNSGSYSYSTEAGMLNYTWTLSPGGIFISGEETNIVSVNWIGPGPQWVKVNYATPSGCNAQNPGILHVFVSSLPGTPGPISGSPNVCSGSLNVPYSIDSVPNALSYIWNLPPGAIIASGAGTRFIMVDFSPTATSGNITVSGYNGCGAGPPSAPLFVTLIPIPGHADPVTGLDTVARGALNISYFVPEITNATGYLWTLPTGATIASGMNTNAILVDFSIAAFSGYITVAGANDCGPGDMSPLFPVTVTDPPTAPVIYLAGDSLISNSSIGNQWFYNGNLIPEATNQVYHPIQSGWYWDVVNRYGVQSDTSNNIYVTITGINEKESGTVQIYPVPNQGRFTVSANRTVLSPCILSVYDQLGLKVYERKIIPSNGWIESQINLEMLPVGIYTLSIKNAEIRFVKKIIITR